MSKKAPPYRQPTILGKAERTKLLDKYHVEKMARAMMGVLVAFAFDDAQGQRAACWLVAHTCKQLGTTREAVLERVGLAYDIVFADVKPDLGLVQQ